jgi:hypothetical protein
MMQKRGERMRRLLAAGLLPGRAGAGTKALVHIAFAELRALPAASRVEAAWVARAQQDWAGHRAAAAITGGDGGAWLTGPAGIRQAVLQRARGHCEWAGGCRQPAGACHIHHITRKADGGNTSVNECLLLCSFHHLVAVHRWGWRVILNQDGTTTAYSPDGTKVLRSHGPPPRPG